MSKALQKVFGEYAVNADVAYLAQDSQAGSGDPVFLSWRGARYLAFQEPEVGGPSCAPGS